MVHIYRPLGHIQEGKKAVKFILAYDSKSKGQIEEKGKLCKCMHELPSRGDIYGRIERPELMGVTFEFLLYIGVINI